MLAESLAQRKGGFTNATTPRPTPYYRFVIKSHREGFITRTIIWVPSRKLWFDKEYVTPPLAGFWRTDQVSLRSRLMAFVRNLNPTRPPPNGRACCRSDPQGSFRNTDLSDGSHLFRLFSCRAEGR